MVKIRARVEEVRVALEAADRTDKKEREDEAAELRSILDTVWHQARIPKSEGSSKRKQYFQYNNRGEVGSQESYKECVGDQEDVHTLYQLVQESLGESVRLTKEFEELKATVNQ